MSLPQLIEISDLSTWLGVPEFTGDDWARADKVIEAVSALIRREAGETWVDEDGEALELPPAIPGLAVTVAARVWENPTFVTQRTTGPFSVSFGPQVGLYLTDEEQGILPHGSGSNHAFTVNTINSENVTDSLYGALINGPDDWAPQEPPW